MFKCNHEPMFLLTADQRRKGRGWHDTEGEDKRTAMGYAKDFQDPRVLGDLLLPWPGEGDKLEFRDLAASQVWAGVPFASERLSGGGGGGATARGGS